MGAEENLLEIRPLEEPDEIPAEEKNDDFISAFERAKVSDVDYLVKLEALESEGRDDEVAVARLDRELRAKVRVQLGLTPRPNRKEFNRADHARSFGIDPSLELPPNRQKDAHTDLVLQTLKYPDELESFLEKISDDARLAEQEMGVSTLFLAFGFLEWYEADHSDKNAFAPLLLLPVRLEDKKVKGKTIYFLSAREGVVEANLSLQKLLEKDFNLLQKRNGRRACQPSDQQCSDFSREPRLERVLAGSGMRPGAAARTQIPLRFSTMTTIFRRAACRRA